MGLYKVTVIEQIAHTILVSAYDSELAMEKALEIAENPVGDVHITDDWKEYEVLDCDKEDPNEYI